MADSREQVRQDAEKWAQKFHETYEALAPSFNYETREASAVPWADVPEPNRALMIATVDVVLDAVLAELEQAERELEEARENIKRQLRLGTEQVRAERDEALRKRDGLMAQLGRTEYRLAVLKNLAPAEDAAYTQADLDFFADNADDYAARAFKAEARLARVPALVEALRLIGDPTDDRHLKQTGAQMAREALRAWEQE